MKRILLILMMLAVLPLVSAGIGDTTAKIGDSYSKATFIAYQTSDWNFNYTISSFATTTTNFEWAISSLNLEKTAITNWDGSVVMKQSTDVYTYPKLKYNLCRILFKADICKAKINSAIQKKVDDNEVSKYAHLLTLQDQAKKINTDYSSEVNSKDIIIK
jgi:hypothetical protein